MAMWFLILTVLPIVVTSDDPCHNYDMLNDDGGRSINCSRYYSESHDSFISEGWRRVQLESTGEDLTMPTHCIPHGYCGSHSNVWLNGNHPTVEDGIVDRMGCLSMFSSCCYVEYPIQIKNCTDYMVYNLKRTIGDDQRYCFGDSDECYHETTTYRPQSQSKDPETFPTKTSDYPFITTTNKEIPDNHLVVNARGELPKGTVTYQPDIVTSDDPCYNYELLNDDGGRSIKCSRYYSESHDSFIDEGWRRVQLESTGEDLTMPTQCIPHSNCGSHSNVWLNGNHPTVEDGIVDRMGCLSMFSSCCYVEYPIQIKNCTDYMVYNLKRTVDDDQRYCFGDSDECYHETTIYRPQSQSKDPETFPTKTSDYPFITTTNREIPDNHLAVNARGELPKGTVTYQLETAVCVAVILTSIIIVVLGVLYYSKRWRDNSIAVVKLIPTKA